ncbi:MAG: hypothetical protein GY810_15125 [Aureispira sp.]|nr:hypothetical protein [Aureispira sp.]
MQLKMFLSILILSCLATLEVNAQIPVLSRAVMLEDCTSYDELSNFVKIGGGLTVLLWTATYILMALQAFRSKRYGLPIVALSIMWGYEFCFTFLYSFDGSLSLDIIEAIWFALDTLLLVQVFLYYRPDWVAEPWGNISLQRIWPIGLLLMLLFSVLGCSAVIKYFMIGPNLAFLVCLILSASYIPFLLSRPTLDGVSNTAMYTRVLAGLLTLIVTVLGFPFQNSFELDLCARSSNNLLSVFILSTTVVLDFIALYIMRSAMQQNSKN